MADTPKRAIYGLDSSKYPARMGKGWDQEEIVKLLDSIRNKKSIEEIATEHERTVGGINSRRRGIATDYYFNNNLSIDKIQKFTGLTGEEIEDAIKRYRNRKKVVEEINTMPNQLEEFTKPKSKASEIAELKIRALTLNLSTIFTLSAIICPTGRMRVVISSLQSLKAEKQKSNSPPIIPLTINSLA